VLVVLVLAMLVLQLVLLLVLTWSASSRRAIQLLLPLAQQLPVGAAAVQD